MSGDELEAIWAVGVKARLDRMDEAGALSPEAEAEANAAIDAAVEAYKARHIAEAVARLVERFSPGVTQ